MQLVNVCVLLLYTNQIIILHSGRPRICSIKLNYEILRINYNVYLNSHAKSDCKLFTKLVWFGCPTMSFVVDLIRFDVIIIREWNILNFSTTRCMDTVPIRDMGPSTRLYLCNAPSGCSGSVRWCCTCPGCSRIGAVVCPPRSRSGTAAWNGPLQRAAGPCSQHQQQLRQWQDPKARRTIVGTRLLQCSRWCRRWGVLQIHSHRAWQRRRRYD